jgi:hypothetical protein
MAGQGRANSFAQGLMSGGIGQAGNTIQQGAQNGGGALGGLYEAAKNAAPPLMKLGFEVADLPGKIQEWSRQLVESQRHLAQYNGTIAGATAQLDADRINRGINRASQTSESFKELTESQSRLEDASQPFAIAWQNASNNVMDAINGVAASFLEGLAEFPLVAALLDWLGYEKTQRKQDPYTNEVFHTMADDIRRKNRQPLPKL